VTGRKLQQHGVVGDDLPDLEPVDLQSRLFQAPELLDAGEEAPPRALDAA
jgi:hypothetical protein